MSKRLSPLLKCRSCGSRKLSTAIDLGEMALSDFVSDNSAPSRYPLTVIICDKCSLLQLKHTTPQSLLYTENYGYKSGINQTMKEELKGIADESLALISKKDKITVVDIGANDGTLLKYYPKNVKKVGVEPVKKFARECADVADIVINDFFNYDSFVKKAGKNKVDVVSAISCFYDMEEPNEFVKDVTKILSDDGVFVIQQNYIVKMLTQNAFDNIVHEHLEYYSLISLSNLLKRHNLEVFDLELRELNGGSFRTYIAFKGKRMISNRVHEQLQLEDMIGLKKKQIYVDFSKRIKKARADIQSFLKTAAKKKKSVYLYGASTRGNTLLQYFKISSKQIPFAVERNPEKWGKKIASTGIPIISEEQARKDKPDYMLVLPWFFKTEFLKREKKYLDGGGHFIFPLSQFEIV
jgi:NDP-4-keto-2,6-dideoxyhexose 3-C-methyltransferase